VAEVDEKELIDLITEINTIYNQRTSVERESQLKIKQLQQGVAKL